MAKSYSTFQDMAASDFSSISGTKSKPAKQETGSTPTRSKTSGGIMSKSPATGGGSDSDSSSGKTSKGVPSSMTSQLNIGSSGASGGFMESISNYVSSYFDSDDEDESIVTLDAEAEEEDFADLYSQLPPLEETLSDPSGMIPQITSVGVDPLLLEGSTQGFTSPAAVPPVATGLDVVQAMDVDAKAARTRESTIEANRERESFSGDFYTNIGVFAETDHGNTPQVSNDAADVASGNVTYDIGYGHKITSSEFSSGEIHGIQFIDDSGDYIPLTQEQKEEIMQADFEMHEQAARDAGWDRKLEERDSSWDELDTPYQNALASLAYNVGGGKAGQQWTRVLDHAIAGSRATNNDEEQSAVRNFARHLRRTDAGRNTAGMDNRVAKELYFAGLIDSLADVSSVLPLANAAQAGIPATAEYGSNPNRRPSGSQD